MGGSVSSGFVSGGCVGVISGGVVGFVSSGCVVGMVDASVACWVDWFSVGNGSSADPAGLVHSVLFQMSLAQWVWSKLVLITQSPNSRFPGYL